MEKYEGLTKVLGGDQIYAVNTYCI